MEPDEVAELKEEVLRLKVVITELTAVIKLLTERDDRAKVFVSRIEELLNG